MSRGLGDVYKRQGSRNDKSLAHEVEFLSKVKAHLEDGKLAKTFEVDDEEDQEILNSCNLLTIKPVIFAANVNEDELAGEDNDYVKAVREYAADVAAKVFVVCAQIEQEISELDDDEKKEFLEDLGLEESGLEKLISASYSLLGLISFLTSGEDETRAWTIKEGTKAPQAAGKIHTDFERGFIRAEVVSYDDLIACGSHTAAKEKGLIRLEGKDYVVTWALGHLVTLADPEEYDKKYTKWELSTLPMMPEKMKLVVIRQTSKQYNAVKTQLYRKDIGEIIIATDAGREGELVARWILAKADCHKPIKRLWICLLYTSPSPRDTR